MALSKAAQEYLMALETERQKVEKEKGAGAAKAYVDDQKRKGQNFRDADVRSAKIDPNGPVVKAARQRLQNKDSADKFEQQSRARNQTAGMFNGMPSFVPNNATVGQGSPKQSPAEKAASGRRDMDSIRRQNAMDRKKQDEKKPAKKKSDVYSARQQAAEYARNK